MWNDYVDFPPTERVKSSVLKRLTMAKFQWILPEITPSTFLIQRPNFMTFTSLLRGCTAAPKRFPLRKHAHNPTPKLTWRVFFPQKWQNHYNWNFPKSNPNRSHYKQIVVGYMKWKCSHLSVDWDYDTILHINTIYTAKSIAFIRIFQI